MAHFLRPGGFFYIAEAHPFAWVFDDDATATELRLRYHYWPRPEPLAFTDTGSCADPEPPVEAPFEYAWQQAWARSSPRWPRPAAHRLPA